MRRKCFSAVMLILAAMLAVSCSEPARLFNSDSKSLAEPDNTVLRIACAPENEPFVYTDPSGELLGFDPSLALLLAERLGMTAAFYPMDREYLADSLNCGLADIAVSALEATDVMRRKIDFSDSYITLASSIVANGGNAEINGEGDLKLARNVGAVSGSLPQKYLTDELGLSNMSAYPNRAELEGAMLRGDIDIMFCDGREAEEFVAEYPLFVIKEDDIDRRRYSIAAADGNTKLLREINGVLDEFRTDGTLLDLRKAYINGDNALRAEFDARLENIGQVPRN